MDTLIILESVLGTSHKSSSDEYLFHCPFCHHRKPKLSVNLGRRSGFWKCWVCNESGKTVNSLLYRMDVPYTERRYILSGIDGVAVAYETDEQDQPPLTLPKEFIPLAEYLVGKRGSVAGSVKTSSALRFLFNRGISLPHVIRYNIGFAKSGEYADRLIIPSYDVNNNLNYFTARAYFSNPMKYKNPQVSKNQIIFENLIRWDKDVVLVEGVFDAITVSRNATPLLGKTLSTKLKIRLLETKPPHVYVMLDQDAKKEAYDIHHWMSSNGINSSVVNILLDSDGKSHDPSSLGFDRCWDSIMNSKESKFSDLVESKLGVLL